MNNQELREVKTATADIVVVVRRLRTARASLERAGLFDSARRLKDDIESMEGLESYLRLTLEHVGGGR